MLLRELVGPERNCPARRSCPATRLRLRESSIELMIERSLPSSRCAHAAHGAACLDRQSWAVTDGPGNRQLIPAARQTLQRRTITAGYQPPNPAATSLRL